MTRHIFLGAILTFGLATAGCQGEKTDPMAPPSASELTATKRHLNLNRTKLPWSMKRLPDRYFTDARGRVINPDDYVCPASTDLGDWINGEVADIPEATLNRLFELGALDVAFVDALVFQSEETPQEFGYNGEYTKILEKTQRDMNRFWDIPSDDIELVAMKGSMLVDVDRVATIYQIFFLDDDGTAITPEEALQYATELRTLILDTPVLNGGDHPLFSFNAFAVPEQEGLWPDKIVMGDGVLAGYEALGFEDVAPQAVYAHEFAHHIQFANDYFDDEVPGATTDAELTRYTELMADAYSAYYLTHKRGAAMNRKRVELFLQVFFEIGDCAFEDPNHHGTPNQRMAAAQFGFDLADQAQKQGHILTSEQFHDLFVAAYPDLIAPDAA